MGQKTDPRGFRLGITRTWDSRWYAKKDYAKFVAQDSKIRELVKAKLSNAGVARTEIERRGGKITVKIHTARPGLVIGKKGTGIDALKIELQSLVQGDFDVTIHEVRKA